MPRPDRLLQAGFIILAAASVVAGTAYLAVYVATQQTRSNAQISKQCQGAHHMTPHKVLIRDSKVIPSHTTGSLCGTLTIVNLDSEVRLLAFGVHDKHQPYDGIGEKVLRRGQSLTVTLVQAGNFRFHDHIHDEVQGTFTVTPAP